MHWSDLFAAFGLVLVIEGILPFVNPAATRRAFELLSKLDEGAVRKGGLISMIVGLVVLYLVRH